MCFRLPTQEVAVNVGRDLRSIASLVEELSDRRLNELFGGHRSLVAGFRTGVFGAALSKTAVDAYDEGSIVIICENQYTRDSRSGSAGPDATEHRKHLRNLDRLEKPLDA